MYADNFIFLFLFEVDRTELYVFFFFFLINLFIFYFLFFCFVPSLIFFMDFIISEVTELMHHELVCAIEV